jgi:hypothetical protein
VFQLCKLLDFSLIGFAFLIWRFSCFYYADDEGFLNMGWSWSWAMGATCFVS